MQAVQVVIEPLQVAHGEVQSWQIFESSIVISAGQALLHTVLCSLRTPVQVRQEVVDPEQVAQLPVQAKQVSGELVVVVNPLSHELLQVPD